MRGGGKGQIRGKGESVLRRIGSVGRRERAGGRRDPVPSIDTVSLNCPQHVGGRL